jgi:MFS family permease
MPNMLSKIKLSNSLNRDRIIIPVFIVAVLFYWMGLYLYSPTLPLYVQDKTDNLAVVGVVLSMYGLWQLLVRLPLGILIDWVGWRKPFIMVGLGVVAISALVMGHAQDITMLGFGRALSGVSAATWVPLVVLFSSLYMPGNVLRSTGLLSLVGSLGRIIATGSSGILNNLGGYSLAFNVAAITAGMAILLIMFVPDQRQTPRRPSPARLGKLFLSPVVLIPSLLSCLFHYADWSSTASFLPILARQLGATEVKVSLLVSLNMGVSLIGNLIATTIVNRIGYRRMLFTSITLLAIGLASAALSPSLTIVFLSQICIGLAFGVAYPVLMGLSISQVDPVERNSAMGLHQSVYAIGMFAGPWLSGILANYLGLQPMFGITAAAILILGLLGSRLLKNE